jgi:hypothetical protein
MQAALDVAMGWMMLSEAAGANPSGKMPENNLTDGKGWGSVTERARHKIPLEQYERRRNR